MLRKSINESSEPVAGRLGICGICTAKASRISRETVKSGCAREWGGWGRLSEDGPGQNNPDRSEGPWGRAAGSARTEVLISASIPDTEQGIHRWQQRARRTMANQCAGKASFESPALKPYRGKPAVRNFRGGNGNVGIIRSPVRAIALPDKGVSGPQVAQVRGFLHVQVEQPCFCVHHFVESLPRTKPLEHHAKQVGGFPSIDKMEHFVES